MKKYLLCLSLASTLALNYSCSKEKRFAVTTEDPIEVYACRATLKAIGERGTNKKISEKGFCYSSERIPEFSDNTTPSTNGFVDLFEAEVKGLLAKTKYYVRAYTKLTDGTIIMGNVIEFTTTDVYQVGDTGPAGGYIFTANPSTSTGKYSECILTGVKKEWGCYGKMVGSTDLTTSGLSNTNKIASNCGSNTAAVYCLDYTKNGYSDWYLPSVGELSLVYSFAQSNPGKIPADWYFSSSEDVDILCYGMDFGTSSSWIRMAKSIERSVIAVRIFN